MVHSAFGSSVRVFASNVSVIIELPMFVVNVKFVRTTASGHVFICSKLRILPFFLRIPVI